MLRSFQKYIALSHKLLIFSLVFSLMGQPLAANTLDGETQASVRDFLSLELAELRQLEDELRGLFSGLSGEGDYENSSDQESTNSKEDESERIRFVISVSALTLTVAGVNTFLLLFHVKRPLKVTEVVEAVAGAVISVGMLEIIMQQRKKLEELENSDQKAEGKTRETKGDTIEVELNRDEISDFLGQINKALLEIEGRKEFLETSLAQL